VSSASTTLGRGSASGSLARFELSAQARRRSEDLAPAASTTSERRAMLAHPSTELVARAPCQLRHSHARPVRAARARLRQQRRLEVDKTRKRDVQTGGPTGPSSSDGHAGTLADHCTQGPPLRRTCAYTDPGLLLTHARSSVALCVKNSPGPGGSQRTKSTERVYR